MSPPVPETNDTQSKEHGSIQCEMIARLSYKHPLVHDDSSFIFDDIEPATRGIQYAASIISFKKKDGRGVCRPPLSQFAGKSVFNNDKKNTPQLPYHRE